MPEINIGAAPNDGTGDALRVAFGKVNQVLSDVGEIAAAVAEDAEQTDLDRTQTGLDRTAAENARAKAQDWAEGTLPGGAGTKSAREHSADAGAKSLLTAADALATAADRGQTGLDRAAAASSAAQAGVARDVAATLAAAAGAPSGEALPTLPDAGYPADSYFRLLLGPGIQIWRNDAGTWVYTNIWERGPKFDTVALLLAYSGVSLGPSGTIVEAGGYRYKVVTTGQHRTTAGGVKLYAMPLFGGDFGGVYCPEQFGAIGVDALYLDVPNKRWCTDAGLTTPAVDYTAEVQAAVNAGRITTGCNRVYMVTEILLKSESVFRDFRLRTKPGTATNHYWSPVTIGGNFNTIGLLKKNILVENVHVDGGREIQVGMDITRDGGRHGFWLAGYTENVTIRKCSGVYCATDGIHINRGLYTAPAPADDSRFMHTNLVIDDCVFDWNRRHGGSGDSIKGFICQNSKFRNNGKNLDGYLDGDLTDPEKDALGAYGEKVSGNYYANGWDMEGYGIGSCVQDITFKSCDLRNNIRDSILFYDTANQDAALFLPRKNISIIDCDLDTGDGNSNGDYCLTFTSTLANKVKAPLYENVTLTGNRYRGAFTFRSVDTIALSGGWVEVPATTQNLGVCDHATNVMVHPARTNQLGFNTVNNSDVEVPIDRTVQATWNPGTIAAGGKATTTIALPGAAYGDLVQVTHNQLNTVTNAEVILTGYVVFPGEILQIVANNNAATSKTIPNGTVRAICRKLKMVHP